MTMSDLANPVVQVTNDELLVINNSINEILHGPHAIVDWEFQTRIGVNREFAEKVLAKISSQYKATGDSDPNPPRTPTR